MFVLCALCALCAQIPPEVLEQLKRTCNEVTARLKAAGVRVVLDDRDDKSPGWKWNHWEQKGVPMRLEFGPRDLQAGKVRLVLVAMRLSARLVPVFCGLSSFVCCVA